MRGIFHGAEGFSSLSEGENAVDDRPEASLFDGPLHFQEMLARTYVNATYLQHFVQDRCDVEVLLPAPEHADLCDDPTGPGSSQGLLKSACAAHFDREIDPSARRF